MTRDYRDFDRTVELVEIVSGLFGPHIADDLYAIDEGEK